MTYLKSQIENASIFLSEGSFMEKRVVAPVRFHFEDQQEMIDMYYAIEFKFFIQKLLYSRYIRKV